MDNLYDLVLEKNSLPKGQIYQKKINGHLYYYHQYSIDGVKYTKKIKDDEVEELQKQIDKRINIEKKIKDILNKGNKQIVLSKNAKELTGNVMCGDKVVAAFNHGELISLNEKLCPLIIKRTKRLEPFLKTRVIDSGRTNSRILKKALNIKESDDSLVSLCSYAASISDNYWFKPLHSKLKYKDISFESDMFFNISLKGLVTFYSKKAALTPELTTTGSYEKGWKNVDGEWWLYKQGSKNEIFSELLYANIFENLKLPTAHYEYDSGYIKSKNFVSSDVNFEPIISIAGDNEDYHYIYNLLKEINEDLALQYIRLCFFDVVLNNIDRHNENCGLLRDRKTGKIISLAPNYDDNLSLISRDTSLLATSEEGFLKRFISEIKKHKELLEGLKKVDIPTLDKEIVIKSMPNIDIGVDKNKIIDYILFRFNYLYEIINK